MFYGGNICRMIPSENLDSIEEIEELIRYYGLEEDPEYIIVPFTDRDGKTKRRFILKRKFIRVIYAEGQFVDYPLSDVIKATAQHPELPLSAALYLMYQESDAAAGRYAQEIDENAGEKRTE
jgi:hypothetical protein